MSFYQGKKREITRFSAQDIMHQFARPLWEERAIDIVDHFLDEQADIQTTFHSGKGPDCLKQSVMDTFQAFPDLEMIIEDGIQQGNKLLYRWEASACHEGTILGVPRTGIKTRFSGVVYGEIQNGKISVYHSFSNIPQILQSLKEHQHEAQILHSQILEVELRKHTLVPLTPREIECLRHWVKGCSIKDCARSMGGLSERTVQTYRESIKHKFNAKNYQGLVSILQKCGLISILLE